MPTNINPPKEDDLDSLSKEELKQLVRQLREDLENLQIDNDYLQNELDWH